MAKYDRDGNQIEIVEKLKNGQHLIRKIFTDESYEWVESPHAGKELFIVNDVFDSPPAKKLSQEIVELKQEIVELQCLKRNLAQGILDVEKAGEAKLAKYKKYDQIKILDMFLDGKITHYVLEYWGSFKIISFEDAVPDERWGKDKVKLLTLFGKTGGNLEWRLNEYSDGSGNNTTVTPCLSYEEALKIAQDIVDAAMDNDYQRPGLIRDAKKYGLKIDPEYIKKCEDKEYARKDKEIKDLEKRIEELKKKI